MKLIHRISALTFVFLGLFSTVLTCVKLRHCEKATKFEKKIQPVLMFTQYVVSKQVGDFFQIFVAFSENLNFTLHYT